MSALVQVLLGIYLFVTTMIVSFVFILESRLDREELEELYRRGKDA